MAHIGPTTFEEAVKLVGGECTTLLIAKQRDYGPLNMVINHQLFGYRHFATRFLDKVCRLANLLERGGEPKFESIDDTFTDIANYALIALMMRRGWWELPLEEKE